MLQMILCVGVCVDVSNLCSDFDRVSDLYDECALGTHNCATDAATCTDTTGAFDCQCISGYVGDGIICTGNIRQFPRKRF